MEPRALLALVLVLVLVLGVGWCAGAELVCFYGSWARLREGEGRVGISQLDPHLCTTYIFAFARLNPTTSEVLHTKPDELLYYRQLTGLKRRNPRLRVELAVGGWNDSQRVDYAAMAGEAARRATFARSAAAAVERFGFDGLHMDWEFPDGDRQRRDYTRLLRELRRLLTPRGRSLAVAAPASAYRARRAFEMGAVARLVDRVLLMAYDTHGSWMPTVADHHAPLLARRDDFSGRDAESAVRLWRTAGAEPRQLVLGVPLYGRGWLVEAPSRPPMDAQGAAPAGPILHEEGVLSYLEICLNVLRRGWTTQQLTDNGTVYGSAAVGDGQWFGYDDEEAAAAKARLAVRLGLAGVFVWEVALDDVRGLCTPRPFTLTTIIKDTLENASRPTENSTAASEDQKIQTVGNSLRLRLK